MDPLTHTLVGASLAATRLGKTTRLAGTALVVGANLPDVDVLSYFWGSDAALGFRRGWTHGVVALLVLPAVFALLLWMAGRWRPSAERPLSGRWLLALSYIAILTHPALDWLNTYGMRWGMPLSETWFYGDSVFIIDPWLWLILGSCWLAGRRPTAGLTSMIVLFSLALLWIVGIRAWGYLPILATVLGALLLVYFWKPRGSGSQPRLPAAGLAVATVFILGMLGTHRVALNRVTNALHAQGVESVPVLVAPLPANPLTWDVVVQDSTHYGLGTYDFRSGELRLEDRRLLAARGTETWKRVEASGQLPGFRRWARLPWIEAEAPPEGGTVFVMDARYARSRTTGFGGSEFELAPLVPESSGNAPASESSGKRNKRDREIITR